MNDHYALFPRKRILPYDGMSITASVWDEAHTYHARLQDAHQFFMHGTGIAAGLEVIASDPPSSVIFVLPGVAIDNAGRMIVLPEPVAYDLGDKISGRLHLNLVHREVKIQDSRTSDNNLPAYLQAEYVIVARSEALETPHVEIARIHRAHPNSSILDAEDPGAPGINSIDLRYRLMVCPPPLEQVMAGVCLLNPNIRQPFVQGLVNLAAPLAQATPYRLIVENQVPIDSSLFDFQMLYLIADGQSKINPAQTELLQSYVQNGGRIVVEFSEAVSEESAAGLLKAAGITLSKTSAGHPLYRSPHLFVFPPQGSLPRVQPALYEGEPGVLVSTGAYGILWSGLAQQPEFTREVVRSAVEWGVNMLAFLLNHNR